MKQPKKLTLIRVPKNIQSIVFLIREELKARKLSMVLAKIGVVDCPIQPHLDLLVLQQIRCDISDQTFELYNAILERRSRKMKNDAKSINKHAFKAYHELIKKLGE